MGRSHTKNAILGIFGAVVAGVSIVAFRSCRGRGKRARQPQREVTALKKAINRGLASHRLEEGVFGAPPAGAVDTALVLAPMAMLARASLNDRELAAQKRAAFEDMTSLIMIPAPLRAFNTFLMDSSIIFSLGLQLKSLLCQLNELDMVREWPAGGDSLLWQGCGTNSVCKLVLSRSSAVVAPALAIQMATLEGSVCALLQQRQDAREHAAQAKYVLEIIEIQEMEASNAPALSSIVTVMAASCPAPALDRSVSDASSTGTPDAASPMSARGSVVEVSSSELAKPAGKSPLGDLSRQSSQKKANTAGPSRLNANAAAFVPTSAPAAAPAAPRNYRPRRRHRSSASHAATAAVPPPPPPPPRRRTPMAPPIYNPVPDPGMVMYVLPPPPSFMMPLNEYFVYGSG